MQASKEINFLKFKMVGKMVGEDINNSLKPCIHWLFYKVKPTVHKSFLKVNILFGNRKSKEFKHCFLSFKNNLMQLKAYSKYLHH